MRKNIVLVFVSAIAAAGGGYWYGKMEAEINDAHDRIERLHRLSRDDVLTYIRLLQQIRGDDKAAAIIYLEALLSTAQLQLNGILREYPDDIHSSSGHQALTELNKYRMEHPLHQGH